MLFKYSGKYVNIYFNMKITFSIAFGSYSPPTRFNCLFEKGVGGLEGRIGLAA